MQRILAVVLVVMLVAISAVACSASGSDRLEEHNVQISTSPAPPAEYRRITPQEAWEIMQSGEPHILLDVRAQHEFDAQHIEGAILIPHTQIADRAEKELPDRAALILVYCQRGVRSETASIELLAMGYTNVLDFGGIISWQAFLAEH